ncbi:demethoxyubiquinone hydroxylase family protein [Methanobacterium spitsbergense]|uniref:Demethoxyubiquinone hydroxylase family protein n=1 Tax=Methanobacterium spitsbergense TaxID=2874285 RepID=A0A8T5UY46_9EURY|nr:demethoxyubiquinone hydroxylase family protein [Methanobacterium spitsbergense]MBZ2166856.1 demethoxyubiquinone hydroxylase family protein [Methanobacterium spitsbergense]
MLSKIPIDLGRIKQEDLDKEILRAAIIGELDAINLYEEFANMTDNEDLKAVLQDIAEEEKTHVGEFQTMLLRIDKEQAVELEKGKKEVEELTGKK